MELVHPGGDLLELVHPGGDLLELVHPGGDLLARLAAKYPSDRLVECESEEQNEAAGDTPLHDSPSEDDCVIIEVSLHTGQVMNKSK
jgi:hypothetical protein